MAERQIVCPHALVAGILILILPVGEFINNSLLIVSCRYLHKNTYLEDLVENHFAFFYIIRYD
jgi:hypothetical protein